MIVYVFILGTRIRVFLRIKDGSSTKPLRIDNGMSYQELKELIKNRMGLSNISKLSVSNGSVEWDIEEDDDVSELLSNDVITIQA